MPMLPAQMEHLETPGAGGAGHVRQVTGYALYVYAKYQLLHSMVTQKRH
jgi:hypothetical protein